MKNKVLIISFFLVFMPLINSNAQEGLSSYDKTMISLAKEVAKRVRERQKLKVATWYFTDTFGKKTELGDYISRDFSIHFTNEGEGLQVLDRDHFEQILKEQGLNSEGFIDPSTAKRVGMLIAADAIITGTVDVGLHHLRVRIKVINTETGMQIAAGLRSLPIDENLKIILKESSINEPIRRTNKPRLDRSETEQDPRETEEDCEKLQTGNYCLNNKSKYDYLIDIRGIGHKFSRTITIDSGEDACLYDIPVGEYNYRMHPNKLRTTMPSGEGSFRVQRCKSLSNRIGASFQRKRTVKGTTSPRGRKKITVEDVYEILRPYVKKKRN